MSSFTRANAAISYDHLASLILKEAHWRNLQLFRFYIGKENSNEWVDMPAGMLSDGASVPFPVNALIPAWGSYSQAVLLHDRLCHTYEKTVLRAGVVTTVKINRAEIDSILAEAMAVLGVEPWRSKMIMAGVNTYRFIRRPSKPDRNPIRLRLELDFNPETFAA